MSGEKVASRRLSARREAQGRLEGSALRLSDAVTLLRAFGQLWEVPRDLRHALAAAVRVGEERDVTVRCEWTEGRHAWHVEPRGAARAVDAGAVDLLALP